MSTLQITVSTQTRRNSRLSQRQALKNLEAVLEASGSSKRNVLKVNIFITTMDDFATMNEAYDEFFSFEPKPVSQVITGRVIGALSLFHCRPGLVLLSSSSPSTLMLRLSAQRI